jgi:hypothetical protein
MNADLLNRVEFRGLRASGQTIREIAARTLLSETDCRAALDVLVAQGRASSAHPRGRGLKREPTFKRGPSGMQLLQVGAR